MALYKYRQLTPEQREHKRAQSRIRWNERGRKRQAERRMEARRLAATFKLLSSHAWRIE